MNPLHYVDQSDIDGMADGTLKTYLDGGSIDVRTLAIMTAINSNGGSAPASPSGPVSPTVTELFNESADVQNIHGTIATIAWNGTTEVTLIDAGEIQLQASVGTQSGANNRSTYALRVRHTDSDYVLKDLYYIDSMYVRDDADTYDSGIMAGDLRLFVEAGDKITVEVETIDKQTTTATVNTHTAYSQLRIRKVNYS